VVAAAAICALLGRTATGWLLKPDTDRRRAAVWTFLVQASGSLALLLSVAGWTPAALLLAGCGLFGIGIGNMLFLPPVAVQAEWPPEQVAAVVAALAATMLFGGAFAPGAFGLLRDGFGDWAPAGAALALQVTAAFLVQRTASAKRAT
jgi:MFS family permease